MRIREAMIIKKENRVSVGLQEPEAEHWMSGAIADMESSTAAAVSAEDAPITSLTGTRLLLPFSASPQTDAVRCHSSDPMVPAENFFPDSIRTEQESLSFVKKLTAISISTILYHRGMFPATDYGLRTQGCEHLFILDRKAQTPGAKRIVDMVSASFPAIEKKMLQAIVIGIVDDQSDPDSLIESYTIKFKFFGSKDQKQSGPRIADQAMRLLSDLKELAASRTRYRDKELFFTMRLLFADSEPQPFRPKGFVTKSVSAFRVKGQNEPHSCGEIRTKFAAILIKSETDVTVQSD